MLIDAMISSTFLFSLYHSKVNSEPNKIVTIRTSGSRSLGLPRVKPVWIHLILGICYTQLIRESGLDLKMKQSGRNKNTNLSSVVFPFLSHFPTIILFDNSLYFF